MGEDHTPPVREASTKPTAATVLPAPVACSNQKRRLAPGSSGSSTTSAVSASSQSCGSSSGASRSLSPSSPPSPSPFAARRSPRPWRRCRAHCDAPRPRALDLGGDRGQGSRQGVDLVVVELGAVAQLRLGLPEQPLEAEQQRVVAPPLERGRLAVLGELGQRGVDRPAPGGAGLEIGDRLALEQDRFTGELRTRSRSASLSSLAVSAATSVVLAMGKESESRARRDPIGDGERSKLGKGGRRAEVPSDRTDVPPRSTNSGTDMN